MREMLRSGIKCSSAIMAVLMLFSFAGRLSAQGPPHPPRPVKVTAIQGLAFGMFYHGAAGGTITIDPAGSRSPGGTVVLLPGMPFTQALFEIVGNPGTIITLSFVNPTTLTGTPSGTMTLNVSTSNPPSPFVLTLPRPQPTSLYVGGVLTVGGPGANPPGSYNGTFEIIFNQQ